MQANHYWTMVLAADLGAFAPLSVFQTRPPWALEPPPVLADKAVRRLASSMVRHATIGVNTFPSGHVAVSLAAALAVIGSMPLTGGVLLVLAVSVSLACTRRTLSLRRRRGRRRGARRGVWAAVTLFGI